MSDASGNPFTPAQTRLIQVVSKHLKGVPDADWEAVAKEYPYKDASLAKSKFSLALSKIRDADLPVKTPRKRKSTADGEAGASGTPTKRGKAKVDVGEGTDDTPTKPKRKGKGVKSEQAVKEETPEAKVKDEKDAASADNDDQEELV